jgi:hypothetical protein
MSLTVWARLVPLISMGYEDLDPRASGLDLWTELNISLYPTEALARAEMEKLGGCVLELTAASLTDISAENWLALKESDEPFSKNTRAQGQLRKAPTDASVEIIYGSFCNDPNDEESIDPAGQKWIDAILEEADAVDRCN